MLLRHPAAGGERKTIVDLRELMRPAIQLEVDIMRAANDNDPPRLQSSLSFWWPTLAFCALPPIDNRGWLCADLLVRLKIIAQRICVMAARGTPVRR